MRSYPIRTNAVSMSSSVSTGIRPEEWVVVFQAWMLTLAVTAISTTSSTISSVGLAGLAELVVSRAVVFRVVDFQEASPGVEPDPALP